MKKTYHFLCLGFPHPTPIYYLFGYTKASIGWAFFCCTYIPMSVQAFVFLVSFIVPSNAKLARLNMFALMQLLCINFIKIAMKKLLYVFE